MDDKEFKRFKKRCLHSKKIYQKMVDGSFMKDKRLMAELMDDSELGESSCERIEPRIGKEYQADIPNSVFNLRKKNKKTN